MSLILCIRVDGVVNSLSEQLEVDAFCAPNLSNMTLDCLNEHVDMNSNMYSTCAKIVLRFCEVEVEVKLENVEDTWAVVNDRKSEACGEVDVDDTRVQVSAQDQEAELFGLLPVYCNSTNNTWFI